MATQAAVRITNIVSVAAGTDTFEGIRSFTIQADKGRLLPILKEGHLYPTGAELVGTPDFPVTTSMAFETDTAVMLALLALAVHSLVITYKVAGGGANKAITIANHQFRRKGQSQNLQDFGRPTIEGAAYSADGSALPISVA